MKLSRKLLVLWAVAFVLTVGLLSATASGGNIYYGVENDPCHSSSAEDLRDGVKNASGTKGEMPIKQNRGGSEILEDLDELAKKHGKNGKLDCKNGVFIFHYSGHGSLDNQLRALIGKPGDAITSDDLIDKLLEIVPECCTVLLFIDSCGAGNFQKSLREKVKDEDGKRLSYYGVFGTEEGDDPNHCPRTVDSTGRHVKEGLTEKKPNGKLKADADNDREVTAKELGEYVAEQTGAGFNSKWNTFDFVGEKSHMDYVITDVPIDNAKKPAKKPKDKKDNEGKSGGSLIYYDGTTQILGFSGHHMVDTRLADDPILEASVNIPDFALLGHLSSGNHLFESFEGATLEIGQGPYVFMRARVEYLTYLAKENSFYGAMTELQLSGADASQPFYDPCMPELGSPWIAQMRDLFDPTSPDYDSQRKLYLTYTPVDNMLELTEAYHASAVSTGGDGVFGAEEVLLGERSISVPADADAMISSEDECGYYWGLNSADLNFGGSGKIWMYYLEDVGYLRFNLPDEDLSWVSGVKLHLYGFAVGPEVFGLNDDILGGFDGYPGVMVYGLNDDVAPYTDDNGYGRMGEDWLEGTGDWEVAPGITFNNAPGNADYEACLDGLPTCSPDLCHNGYWTPDPGRTTLLGDDVAIEMLGLEAEWTSLDLGSAGADFIRDDTDGMVTFIIALPYGVFQYASKEYEDGAYTPTLELELTRPRCLSGDVNCDGRVDFKDLAIVADNWLQDVSGPCAGRPQKKCRYRLTYLGCREGVQECSCPVITLGAKCVPNACVDSVDCDDTIVWYYSAPFTDCKAEWKLIDCTQTLIERRCRGCTE